MMEEANKGTTQGASDLLLVATNVAQEKGIDPDTVLEALEQSIAKAGRSRYGQEFDIRAHVNRETGAISLARYREVVEAVENQATEVELSQAQGIKKGVTVGDFITEPLPPPELGRVAALTARQVMNSRVREAERERQYEEFKDRQGEIISGVVKRKEYGHVIVDLGRAEGCLRREELLQRETFERGDRVRAYVKEVRRDNRAQQILLSRSDPQFVAGLFTHEVPEIYDGQIEIKAVAHDAGSRAKIAVHAKDSAIDPVGACVGMRGSRVQAVVSELKGEKIDIIPWSEDTASFVVNAMNPVEVSKVVIDEEKHAIEVVVPESQLSLAIGRRGQNVRLASQLTGWRIDILTEADESERRSEEFKTRSQMFIDELDVDDVIAHLLVTEGFTKIDELAQVPLQEMQQIEGFDESIASELHHRAVAWQKKQEQLFVEDCQELKIDDSLLQRPQLNKKMILMLGGQGVCSRDDLADLSSDELLDIVKPDIAINRKDADAIIMEARGLPLKTDEDEEEGEEGEKGEKGEKE